MYSLIGGILNHQFNILVLNFAILIKLECLVSTHLRLHLAKMELAELLVLVPTVISGFFEIWIIWSLELNVTLWSADFFFYLWNCNISHARYINQRSLFTIWYVCNLSDVVFKLTLVLSWCQTLEWRNQLVLIWRSFYL